MAEKQNDLREEGRNLSLRSETSQEVGSVVPAVANWMCCLRKIEQLQGWPDGRYPVQGDESAPFLGDIFARGHRRYRFGVENYLL